MGVWGQGGGSEFAGYDYVQTAEPAEPTEGQTWYDIDADAAFVYDGSAWIEMTVTDHGQLANVSAGQHRSDQNIRTTVNGQVDADTVDGQHASDLLGSLSYYFFDERVSISYNGTGTDEQTWSIPSGVIPVYAEHSADSDDDTSSSTELRWSDGTVSNPNNGNLPAQTTVSATLDEVYLRIQTSLGAASRSNSLKLVCVRAQ